MDGAELAEQIRALPLREREARIVDEIVAGNVPGWMRELRPVRVRPTLDGRRHEVLFWVTSDYLSVGSDDDYLLVPLSPRTAQRLADRLNGSLPTPAMVDAAWAAADVRLAPQRIAPRDSIESVRTVEYFERHTSLILGQRMLKGVEPHEFVAGHKKDVVISPLLAASPGKVAVYGMHRPDGTPNQELSTVSEAEWVYYNHGVRLVHRRVLVDGVERDLHELLQDPVTAGLLSPAGPIATPRYPTDTRTAG